jgi:hypothetical protein
VPQICGRGRRDLESFKPATSRELPDSPMPTVVPPSEGSRGRAVHTPPIVGRARRVACGRFRRSSRCVHRRSHCVQAGVVAALTRHAGSLRSAAPPADECQASGSARGLMRARGSRVARIRSAPDHGARWDRRETSFVLRIGCAPLLAYRAVLLLAAHRIATERKRREEAGRRFAGARPPIAWR